MSLAAPSSPAARRRLSRAASAPVLPPPPVHALLRALSTGRRTPGFTHRLAALEEALRLLPSTTRARLAGTHGALASSAEAQHLAVTVAALSPMDRQQLVATAPTVALALQRVVARVSAAA